MGELLRETTWWRMVPHPELRTSYAQKYCLADPGQKYLAYLRWGGKAQIDLRPSSRHDTFTYTWYDPRRGEVHSTGTVQGGGMRWFSALNETDSYASDADWVLHVTRRERTEDGR